MYYTIYKITNLVNGKTYIGKHQTNNLDDGYMGSGKLIRRAINKHGIENFKKEILFVFDNEYEMNTKEKELVNEEYLSSGMTYNLCPGGKGGFGYINSNISAEEKKIHSARMIYLETLKRDPDLIKRAVANRSSNTQYLKSISLGIKKHYQENGSHWTGRKHTEKTKQKMRGKDRSGIKNSQFGTCWITNGLENKKIKKEELDNWTKLGYRRGRV